MAKNFACLLDETAKRFFDRVALVWEGGTLTYGELELRASGFARSLAQKGVRAGDRLAILIPNHWSLFVAVVGGLKLGATVSTLNTLLRDQELTEILAALKPKLTVRELTPTEGTWETPDEVNSPALINYSSGSTGQPKGAVISHEALTFATQSWAGPVMGLTPDDTVLAALPLAHAFGMPSSLLVPFLIGARVAIMDRFSPQSALEVIKRERVTVFPGVATMFRRILLSPAFDPSDLMSLRLALSGAAPCPWDLVQEWKARTGKRILRGYGMTELFRPISYDSADPTEIPEAVGRPVPGVEVKVVDDQGATLPCGEVGELLIKSPAAMDGYLDDPEETRALLVDGWFRTGDLAILSHDGYVQIAGRKKERILRGGYSIFSQEVEAALLTHPAVVESAVIGAPSADMGEEVVAFVALKSGAEASTDDLISHCKGRLAAYKYPRKVLILEHLPKGATGKIDKARLMKYLS